MFISAHSIINSAKAAIRNNGDMSILIVLLLAVEICENASERVAWSSA